MIRTEFSDQILRTVTYIKKYSKIIVLTGAGISTASGIPDFRSHGTGLWEKLDPISCASLSTFQKQPELFYTWFIPLISLILRATPNPAHLALAYLENRGFIQQIITQNIDSLHNFAGSKNVSELHGAIRTFSCPKCHLQVNVGDIKEILHSPNLPTCNSCQSILKPDITLFGENLPELTWMQAESACSRAELLIVVGSSLSVYPAANLPAIVLEHGGKLIINNHAHTPFDSDADILLPYDICDTMTALQNALEL